MTVISRQEIETLGRLMTDHQPLISLFLRVDKERIDEDYTIRLKNLLRQAADSLPNRLDHEQREAVLADLERIREFFRDEGDRFGRGVALFASTQAGIWQVYDVPRDVETAIFIGFETEITPLIRLLDQLEPLCTCLISRDRARIFYGAPEEFSEISETLDDVPGQHDQGGWSQARYERHIEEHVRAHFKHVAGQLFALFDERSCRFLVLGGPEEVATSFLEHLHPYVRERFVGTLHLLMVANIKDVREESSRLISRWRRKEKQRIIDLLRDEALSRDQGVVGMDDTIEALQRGQVMTLVLDSTLQVLGAVCVVCRSVQPTKDTGRAACDFCGGALDSMEDVVPTLVANAFRQDAAVVFLNTSELQEQLREIGRIGALLRFNISDQLR
jgi:peptide chain release factor subunit 1